MSGGTVPEPADGEAESPAPSLETIPGRVPPTESARGRYVRLFGWIVVIGFAVLVGWGAVTLVSAVNHG